jgi:glycosyltransferase involved in cell wall biosynthesis
VSAELISIILPTYNGETYLPQALESVRAQTDHDWELLLIDDGSTDRTAEIARQVGFPLRYFYQENRGTAAARNRGVELARGTLFAFLDQDDFWEPHKLEWQRAALQARPELDGVFGQMMEFERAEDLHEPGAGVQQVLKPGILPSGMLIRKDSFLRVGGFDPQFKLSEWSEWYLRATGGGLRFQVLPERVGWRRIHSNNKGNVPRRELTEYARIFKQALDRKRALGGD